MPSTGLLLSPAELAYLHSSLSATPPLRPDLRSATQFRPLTAETGILPGANGSARVCFSDGTEALVGVKAELERAARTAASPDDEDEDVQMHDSAPPSSSLRTDPAWLAITLDLPTQREDDALPTFLASLLTEALLASSATLTPRLRLNSRWHWKLYIDILLLSAPLSYPLPLLSMATHLALANTRLPARTSDAEDDPLFDDDWAAAAPLFDRGARPPVTLLVATVGEAAVFDPSAEELAVADGVLALSVAARERQTKGARLALLAVRTIDPPARLAPLGVPNRAAQAEGADALSVREEMSEAERKCVWSPPRGGIGRGMLARIIRMCCDEGGVGMEVLEGLRGVEV